MFRRLAGCSAACLVPIDAPRRARPENLACKAEKLAFLEISSENPCSSRQKLPERQAPPRSVPRPRPRRLPWRCLIDSARRRRAAGAALAAEKREEAAHLLVVPASSRPDVLRLFRRWGLVAGGFGRCFPGRSGPVSGSTQKKRRCAAGVRLFSSLGPGPRRVRKFCCFAGTDVGLFERSCWWILVVHMPFVSAISLP